LVLLVTKEQKKDCCKRTNKKFEENRGGWGEKCSGENE
jgi:hypothetical protein